MSGQNQNRKSPRWTNSQVDATNSEENPDLTEPIVDTILHGHNVMLPDSKLDGIKVDRTKSEQNPDWTEPAANTILSLKFVM